MFAKVRKTGFALLLMNTLAPQNIFTSAIQHDRNTTQGHYIDLKQIFKKQIHINHFDMEVHINSRLFLVTGYYDSSAPFNKILKELNVLWRGEVAVVALCKNGTGRYILGTRIPRRVFDRAVIRYVYMLHSLPRLFDRDYFHRYCTYFIELWQCGSPHEGHRLEMYY